MRNIGILYDKKVGFNRKKPFLDNRYNIDYSLLLGMGDKYNLNFYLSAYTEYNNKSFKQAWIYKNKWQKVNNTKLDIILDKVDGDEAFYLKEKIDKQLPLINRYQFDLLCTDKWLLYKKFGKYMSKCVLGNDLKNARKLKTKLIVAKPRTGCSGKGIYFINREKIKKISKNYIYQEFINGGKIFQFCGQHDYRTYICNGKIISSTLRLPHKKKYLCNVGQGGRELYYWPPRNIPNKIKEIISTIDKKINKYSPRFYSADFMINTDNQPILLELNSRPALTHFFKPEYKTQIDKTICKMLDNFFKKQWK